MKAQPEWKQLDLFEPKARVRYINNPQVVLRHDGVWETSAGYWNNGEPGINYAEC